MSKNKWSGQKNNILSFVTWGLLVCFLGIIGCADRLYSVNMHYEAEQTSIPGYLRAADKERNSAITVTEFTDVRKADEPLVIGYVAEKDGLKTMVLPKYTRPTQAVASGIKRYLGRAGYVISGDNGQWDLKEETMPKGNVRIIIGGNIEAMELICRRGFPSDSYKARIKLNLVLADATKGKILHRSSVESNTSLEHVSFSEERLEEQINLALAEAIEKVFEDKKVALKLKEALAE